MPLHSLVLNSLIQQHGFARLDEQETTAAYLRHHDDAERVTVWSAMPLPDYSLQHRARAGI